MTIPDHVPVHLVYDFDFFEAPVGKIHPQAEVSRELHANAPAIFYTPRNGGHWAITRYKEADEISKAFQVFSNHPDYDVTKPKFPRHVPSDYDPPEHTDFRRSYNRFFTPRLMDRVRDEIQKMAIKLIEGVKPDGRCEFITQIAEFYSVSIFLEMVKAPPQDRQKLIDLAHGYGKHPDANVRMASKTAMAEYLRSLVDDREKNPGDDLVTEMINARVADREMTPGEKLGMLSVTFFGGLESVASMTSLMVQFLGRHPELKRQLIEDETLLESSGLEELLRVNSINCTTRGVSGDFEFNGIQFRQNDRVFTLRPVIGFDDRQTDAPYDYDLKREEITHAAFGTGPHRCPGSHLARMELAIFLAEWLKRIPEYRVVDVAMRGGVAWGPSRLDLEWV